MHPLFSEAAPGPRGSGGWRDALLGWFRENGRRLPWREDPSPYSVAVSEFMLQQTRVSAVVPYYLRWMRAFPDIASLAAASEEAVLALWQGLGYYSRARNLHALARAVVREHGGAFPQDTPGLRALPGVGEYTAAAIRAFAFDLPDAPLDANVLRVTARWLDFRGAADSAAGRAKLREAALQFRPPGASPREWNSAVMELGALLCAPGKPACGSCPARPGCLAERPETLPKKSPKPAATEVSEARAFWFRDGKLFLERSPGPRWRGLWVLPLAEPAPGETPAASLRYPITRYKVTMEIYARPLRHGPGDFAGKNRRLFSTEETASLPMPPPHRRAVALCLHFVHS